MRKLVAGVAVSMMLAGEAGAAEKAVIETKPAQSFGALVATQGKMRPLPQTPVTFGTVETRWRSASRAEYVKYMNPSSFKKGSNEYYQFLDLARPAGVDVKALSSLLKGHGVFARKGNKSGAAFKKAAEKEKINEVYLVSHALLETGYGRSKLAKGIRVSRVGGKYVPPRVVYNMFGIGALDHDPYRLGAERAYKEKWFTPEAAIIGGAKYVGRAYIHHPVHRQNTLYEMRWDPEERGEFPHQYATDIGWAVKQARRIGELYAKLDVGTVRFEVPKFR